MLRSLLLSAAFLACLSPVGAQSVRTGGLDNWCLNMPTSCSSSASKQGEKYWSDRAVDGDMSSRWASAGGRPPQWLQVDFDTERSVDTVVLVQSDMTTIYANAEEIELSFSAGDPVTAKLPDGWQAQILRFEPRQTTHLRIAMLSAHAERNYLGIMELMAFSDPEQKVKPVQSPRQRWENVDLTPTGREVHPCVNKTPEDVQRALHNLEQHDWARSYVEGQRAAADQWMEKDDQWFLDQIPEPGACFAYGFTGCPICGSSWGTWGGARCSFSDPGYVTCAKGHVLPDADHPDDGTGYKNPDGRIHYFVGSYNAWVVETLQFKVLRPMCLTYLLTGDERYAQKAAVILDGLAAVYPECDAGSWDYPSTPPSGRFCRPWYQVARVLVHYVDFYDELYHSSALDEPSVVEGMTRRQNIEQNLLENGGWYCYEQSLKGGLNNGYSDYIRGALAVGCVLGIEPYVEWALDGPYGIHSIIANNADRDGRYFESSLGYALHARDLYLTFAEPLRNWRSEKLPGGFDVYADPKFLSFYFLPDALFDCAGHMPRYGDTGPDTATGWPEHPLYSTTDYTFAERMYRRTTGDLRPPFAAALKYLAGERGEAARESNRDAMWMLFHAEDFPAGAVDIQPIMDRLTSSDFFGQKGIAILRGGEGQSAQACLLRYGACLNHGHNDDLNLNWVALGREVTYDLGYGLGSTHTQVGWSRHTAAHNVVVVNETSQHITTGCGTGGSLYLLAELPGLRLVEADAPAAYASQGVDEYRRTVALIGEGPGRYLVDVFRVHGGAQHDLMFHTSSDQVSVEGVALGEVEPGSLAGPEYDWGHRQQNDGNLSGVEPRPYWRAPPGNGYGFLVDVRRGSADGTWSATWPIDPSRHAQLRMTGLPEPGTELVTAQAPGIYPQHPRTAAVCVRRSGEGLRSEFLSVIEPWQASPYGNMMRGSAIARGARTDAGTMKYLDAYDVALFQATAPGERMTFTASVPAEGDYRVVVGHYRSPAYGEMRLLIDGQPVGEPFRGTGDAVAPADDLELGTLHLTAGEHEVALEAVAPDGAAGNHWMGLTFLALDPATAQPAPPTARITSLQRLSPNAGDGVGVRVEGADGVVDYLLSAPDAAERTWGGMTVAARFATVRTDARGRLLQANLVGGSRMVAGGITAELERPAWQGRVVEVDEAAREVVLDMVLPAGEALRGQMIAFSNPEYSRNTAYHIESVTVAGDRSRVRVREATFILGKAVLDEAPVDKQHITSLVPHEYAKTMAGGAVPPELDFFTGKLLRSEDGSFSTTLRNVKFGQPMTLTVDDASGLSAGDELLYWDLRPGDEATVQVLCTVTRRPDGTLATDCALPVRVTE